MIFINTNITTINLISSHPIPFPSLSTLTSPPPIHPPHSNLFQKGIYPGPTTTLAFANGTSITNENYAYIPDSSNGTQSGANIRTTLFDVVRGDPEALVTRSSSSSVAAQNQTLQQSHHRATRCQALANSVICTSDTSSKTKGTMTLQY